MGNLDYTQGYSASGISSLIDEVNSIVMKGAGELAVDKVKDVKKVCNDYWDGEAKDNFVTNLEKDSKTFKENLQKLEDAFEAELQNAGVSFKDFDKNLISTD